MCRCFSLIQRVYNGNFRVSNRRNARSSRRRLLSGRKLTQTSRLEHG